MEDFAVATCRKSDVLGAMSKVEMETLAGIVQSMMGTDAKGRHGCESVSYTHLTLPTKA